MSEVDTLFAKMQLLEASIEDFALEVEKIHSAIKGIEANREKVIRKFPILRELLSPKINIL